MEIKRHFFVLNEEVLRRQAVFRKILYAISYPGSIHTLENKCLELIIDCLIDDAVTFYTEDQEIREICRRLGAKEAPLSSADFVISTRSLGDRIRELKRGLPEYPERGATLIRVVESLERGIGVRLRGPGVKGEVTILIEGMHRDEFKALSEVNKLYPLGVDLIVVDRDCRLIAIPRSVRVEV